MLRLAGKRALITGGSTGIGLETAQQFVREGARVAITGRNSKTLAEARAALAPEVLVFESEASDIEAQRKLAADVAREFEQLDVLFVNAGMVDLRPLEQFDAAAVERSFAVNFHGPYFLIQALLPTFAPRASIVLNASVNAHIGMPNTSVYGATKAALLSLSKTLSGELLPRGIRVNAISPGPINTPLYGKLGLPEEELKSVAAAIQQKVPLGRFGSPAEVASAVVFLASDESAFVVGSELVIGGGMATL